MTMGSAVRKKLALEAKESIREDFFNKIIELSVVENNIKNNPASDPTTQQMDLHLFQIMKKELEEHTQFEILRGRGEIAFVDEDAEILVKSNTKPKTAVRQTKKILRRQVRLKRRESIKDGTFVSGKKYLIASPDKHGKMFSVTDKCPEHVLRRQNVSVGSLVLLVTKSKFDFLNENQFVTVLMPGGKINDCFKFSWLEPVEQEPCED